MLRVQYVLMNSDTRDSSFYFKSLEAFVAWSKCPYRMASWRLMGVAAVLTVPINLD